MPSITRTFPSSASPEAIYAYLSDFSTAEEWDPGTRSCERLSGDGGIGTTYRNVSSFMGNTVELTYTATELVPHERVHFVGKNKQFEGHDLITFRADGTGSEVTYHADFIFGGLSRVMAPVVGLYLPKLARHTLDNLRRCLDELD